MKRSLLTDAGLAALLLATGAVQLTLPAVPDERGFVHGGALAWAVLVAMTVPLILRRISPVLVFVGLTAVALVGSPVFGARETSAEAVAHALALYTLVEKVRAPWGAAALAVSLLVAWLHTQEVTSFVYNVAFYGLVFAGGFFQGDRLSLQSQLSRRAAELERERERLRATAIAAERARISSELRQVVAAEVGAMAADACAAREAMTAGASAEPWLTRIESRGRQTLVELRRLLTILRRQQEGAADEDQTAGPPPVEPLSGVLRWFGARPWAGEVLVLAGLGAGLALEITRKTVPSTGTLAVVSTAVAVVVLPGRRRAPLITVAVVSSVIILQQIELQPPLTTTLLTSYMVAVYGIAVARDLRWSLAAILGGAAAYTPHAPDLRVAAASALFTGAVAGFSAALGRSVRDRNRLVSELNARVALLDATRQRRAELAVAEERGRVAREMHDLVAHGVSLMVIQAGGVQSVLASDPRRADEVLARLQATARSTLEEIQLMLAGLEGDEAATSERDLAVLGERLRLSGMDVDLRQEGEPPPLGAGLELSLYRIAQEALTNARKHAPHARTVMRVRYRRDRVELEVRNDAAPAGATTGEPELPGGGHGLVGMRERVTLFNGTLHAGALPDGGFEVRAQIPVAAT